MCGIFCFCALTCRSSSSSSYSSNSASEPRLSSASQLILNNRGPDASDVRKLTLRPDSSDYVTELTCFGSVLHMRGDSVLSQPIVSQSGNVLLFNGEIYSGLPECTADDENANCSDTVSLLSALERHCDDIPELLIELSGEFAFVYYERRSDMLWFGRDKLGRRSLLLGQSQASKESSFVLSSVAVTFESDPNPKYTWSEVQAGVAFYIAGLNNLPFLGTIMHCVSLIDVTTTRLPNASSKSFVEFVNADNFTVCKEPSGLMDEDDRLLCVNASLTESQEQSKDIDISGYVQLLLYSLRQSVTRRLCCSHRDSSGKPLAIGVLFSGGLDSMLLAAIAHEQLFDQSIQIDLINVAFAKKSESDQPGYSTPDRITGLEGYECLKIVYPNRQWNFVRVNVDQQELMTWRSERIRWLIAPANSVLDDSIGCALWFAARGIGIDSGGQPCKSDCRVLLVGAGADELFGGYSRHRVKFSRCQQDQAWSALRDELEMDLRRLWLRNLGRDDRVMSDHAREPRYPYLDEDFVRHVTSLPLDVKCDLRLPRGVGEKRLLRQVAAHLGLYSVDGLAKRAIQFGSRIAKLETSRENAADSCTRLLG